MADQTWAKITSDPAYQSMTQGERDDLARYYARKHVKPAGGDTRAFLSANLSPVKGSASQGSAFAAGVREGFDQSAAGMIANAVTGRPQHGGPGAWQNLKDAAHNIYTGANTNPAIFAAPMAGTIAGLVDPSIAAGANQMAGAMVGQAPDVLTGGLAAAGAAKGLAAAGVRSGLARGLGSSLAGGAINAGAVKATGGTNSDAAVAAALGAALPLASHVPAGRLNPRIGIPKAPSSRIPQVNAANPAQMAAHRATPHPPRYNAIDPPTPPLEAPIPRRPLALPPPAPPPPRVAPWEIDQQFHANAQRHYAGRSLDAQTTPDGAIQMPGQAVPIVEAGPPPGAPVGRPIVDSQPLALPAGRTTTPFPNQDAIPMPPVLERARVGQVGQEPVSPPVTTPPWQPIPGRKVSQPTGGTRIAEVKTHGFKDPASLNDVELLAAWDTWASGRGAHHPRYVEQGDKLNAAIGARGFEFLEGKWQRPDPAAGLAEASLDDLARMHQQARKAFGQARAGLTRAENQRNAKRNLTPHQARKKIGTSEWFERENYDAVAEWPARIEAIEAEAARRGVSLGRGHNRPKGRTVAEAARRLATEEHGTFDPQAMMEGTHRAAGAAVDAVRTLWRGARSGAGAALRAGAAVGNRTSAVERALVGGGYADAIGERTGINDAGRAAGRLIDTALTVPLRSGPEPVKAAVNMARRLLVSGYNVPRDVFERYTRVSPAVGRAEMKRTRELGVEAAGKTSGEQFDLHQQITEPTYRGPVSPDAAAWRAENQRISDLKLAMGLIMPEEHAQWGPHYLPREYALHDAADPVGAARFLAGRMVNKIKGTHGRGTFETVNGQKQWRDYTPAERARWGERRNLVRASALKAARDERQIAAADFLRWVESNPEYTIQPPTGVPHANLPETITGPRGETFRLVSDDFAIPGGKRRGVKRYGQLAGKYVREDVHAFIHDQLLLDDIVKAGNLLTQNNAWKRLKTIWNAPNYFINNVFHNIPVTLANGGAISDLPAAAAKIHANDPLVQRLEADGYVKNDAIQKELAGYVIKAVREQNASSFGPVTFAKMLNDGVDNFRALEAEGHDLAQSHDDLFRVALVDRLMQNGKTYEQAAEQMAKAFYNPDMITAPAARALGATAVPLAKVNWYVANSLKSIATESPLRAAHLMALYYAAPYVVGLLQGKDPETVSKERAALPPHMQGVGNALPIQIPGSDLPTWISFAAANPTNNFQDLPRSATPYWPRGFQPGGFIPSGLPLVQSNGVDSFTGKPIIEYDQQDNVVRDNRADYALRNFAPAAVSNAYRAADALAGHVTPRGDRIPRSVAVARLLGIQAQPVDREAAADRAEQGGMSDASKYRREAYRLFRYADAARENGEDAAADRAEAEANRYLDMADQSVDAGTARSEAIR